MQLHTRFARRGLLAACLTAGFGAALSAAPAAADDYHYMYFKEPVPITLDVTEIAILMKNDATDARLRDDLAASGFDLAGLRTDERPGWRFAATPARAVDGPSLEAVVAEVAARDAAAFASPVFRDDRGGVTVIHPEVFVQFDESVTDREAAALLAQFGMEVLIPNWQGLPNVYKVLSTRKSGFETLADANALALRDDVVFAEPDRLITMYGDDVIPNDPGFGLSWHLHNTGQFVDGWTGVPDMDMNAPQAWDLELGTAGIIVAVLDNGVQQNHPDINQVTPGEDTTIWNGDGGPIFDFDNHGTPVAGIISGIINNNQLSCGVAPNCRTISIKIAYDTEPGSDWTSQSSWVADGVFAAQNRGARITNSSFSMGSSSVVTVAYSGTWPAMMHFASAGNGGDDNIGDPFLNYPASLSVTNAIAAITPTGAKAGFSNYGSGLHFAAPGVSVRTTDRTGGAGYAGGDWTYFGGTSAASPCAAGVAALVYSADPSLNASEVGSIMASTTKDLGAGGYDVVFGNGLPRAEGAVILALFGDDCPGSGACPQDNGTPGCDDGGCCFLICSEDPFCCNVEWDGICAGAAAEICYGCGNTGAGDCFTPNGSPACNNSDCCSQVCAVDPFCCETNWDSICANEAFDLCGPDNDICADAISVGEGLHSFSTIGAQLETDPPTNCPNFGPDVWYEYTADCTGLMTVSMCNLVNGPSTVAVYGPGIFGASCPNGIFGGYIAGCAVGAPGCGFGANLLVEVTAGELYKIRIGGSTQTGQFSIFCGVPGDVCGLAQIIEDGDTAFSTIGASTDGVEHETCNFCCGDLQIHNDIWFSYDATCDGQLTISTCGQADFDTKLAVYTPSAFIGWICDFGPPLTLLGCNDDTPGCAGFTSQVTVDVNAGQNYRFRVGGYNGASGDGTLSVTCTPAGCPADLSGDGTVGAADLASLLSAWGPCAGCPEDLNDDGVVGPADLAALLSAWGPCDG